MYTLGTPCTVYRICKNAQHSKVPAKVEMHQVAKRDHVTFNWILPDFVVDKGEPAQNYTCENDDVSAQAIIVDSHFHFAQQCFFCLGPPNFGLSAQKKHWQESSSIKHPSLPLALFPGSPCYINLLAYIRSNKNVLSEPGAYTNHVVVIGFCMYT